MAVFPARVKRFPGREVLAVFGVLLLLFLSQVGCSDGGAKSEVLPPGDETELLFAKDRLMEFKFELDPAEWDTLRNQHRSFEELIFGSCMVAPPTRVFGYFPAAVTVDVKDGKTQPITVTTVGLRKKCFLGSDRTDKPSLKVKLDEYVEDQQLLGMRHITLNNCNQDPSFVHQCIGYWIFEQAGVPAPRCNFAHVWVNGKDLGLYVHVQSIKKELLARHFLQNHGNLYEGALSDFRPEWITTFSPKTNKNREDRTDLEVVVRALEAPDNELMARLQGVIDLDRFYSEWATEVLIGHWDGYANNTNNFYVYHDPATGKITIIPWGIDAILGNMNDGQGNSVPPPALWAGGFLTFRLYGLPEGQRRYLDRLENLLGTVWNEDKILAEIDRMENMISAVPDPYINDANFPDKARAPAIELVRAFVRTRRASLRAELDRGPPPAPDTARAAPCLDSIGQVSGTFSTTWGTFDPKRSVFSDGTGTILGQIHGEDANVKLVGAQSGLDPNPDVPPEQKRAIFWIVGLRQDNTAVVIAILAWPHLVGPGVDIPLDMIVTPGLLGFFDPQQPPDLQFQWTGLLAQGVVHLDRVGLTPGAPVSGSFNAGVFQLPE